MYDKVGIVVTIGKEDFWDMDEVYCGWYICPYCKEKWIKQGFFYCPKCGTKIKWQL